MTSLKDQLLKAGVVDEKKAKKLEKEKRKQAKKIRKGLAKPDNQAALAAQKSKVTKLAKDQEANREQQRLFQEKSITAQIKQLIASNCIDCKGGDIGYQFTDGKKIKKLYVNSVQQRQLEKGLIAIVSSDQGYQLVPGGVAEKIKQRSADTVMVFNNKADDSSGTIDEDDYYANFKVPDDLMW